MGEFDAFIARLSDEELEARRHSNMGDMNLGDVIDLLKIVRRDLEAGNLLDPAELIDATRNNITNTTNFTQQLDAALNSMSAYGPTNTEAGIQARQAAESLKSTVMTHLRPYLRADEAQVAASIAELRSLRDDVAALTAEAKAQQAALRTESVREGTSGLSEFYKEQAEAHETSAKNFLKWAGWAGVAFAVGIIVLFIAFPPEYTAAKSTEQWIEFLRATTSRILLLSLAGFVLAFCARNYRVNKHLETLNRRRYNALETFGKFQAGVAGDDARNIIVGELVRAVFQHEDTGYLSGGTERTIIESPGGMVTAVASMARTRADG